MELLKLSKFSLQLRLLVTEVRDLRERERSAVEELHLLVEKHKLIEEEHGSKIQELELELSASNESRQKLERKVSYLLNDNILLENKHRELKATIQNLLQSKENFINAYEESTCEMKRSIEAKDRKISILSQRINSQLTLFDSIEREAFHVKQVVENVQRIVSEKEDVVAALRCKMEDVSAFEKVFIGKICELEFKINNHEDELRRKDRTISELEAKLETTSISKERQHESEELQKVLSAKDVAIQNLISENEALRLEVRSLGMILQKIQKTFCSMNQEDRRVFTTIHRLQEECHDVAEDEDNRTEDSFQNRGHRAQNKAPSAFHKIEENDNFKSFPREASGL